MQRYRVEERRSRAKHRVYFLELLEEKYPANRDVQLLVSGERVRWDHLWPPIRIIGGVVLKVLSRSFGRLYLGWGRTLIVPEKLLRALVLQIVFAVNGC